jgi:hypothetical protein
MFKLTEKRMLRLKPILEKYRSALFYKRAFKTHEFEADVKAALETGVHGFPSVVQQLLKNENYQIVAVYYVENCETTGIPSEFREQLARFYGARNLYDSTLAETRKQFWKEVFAGKSTFPIQ